MSDEWGSQLSKALAEQFGDLDSFQLEVGFFEGVNEPDGTPVALVAQANEYGNPAKNVPPRPFMRTFVEENQDNWVPMLQALLAANGGDVEAAFNTLGEELIGQLQDTIRDFSDPPNAPSTVARKGFNDPLIDSGTMLNSVGKEVTKT